MLGNMGGRLIVAPCPVCSSLANGWLATVRTECWTRWALGLIQHQGTSYVLISALLLFLQEGWPWCLPGVLGLSYTKQDIKNVRNALMLDQTKGPSSPALCSHSGQPAIGQGPTRQDMVQQHPPTHVPQQLVHTGLLPQILEIAHNHQG